MSFGKVQHLQGRWKITTDPQIVARLKRVFPRMPQHQANWICISDSIENSRELEWFLIRYPMEMSAEHRRELADLSRAHKEVEEKVARLIESHQPPERIDLAKPARDYQLRVAEHLALRNGLLLADDVGLGKTVSAILPMVKKENLPAVVVVPAHLPAHWREKVAEFAPDLLVHEIRKSQIYSLVREGRQRALFDRAPDVIIISYHKLRGWAQELARIAKYVVFEECQQLRRTGTDISHACKVLAEGARIRMGLSATPIYNYGAEFFPVLDTLIPDCLGEYHEFLREWCTSAPRDKARIRDAEQFGTYLRQQGLMLRRTRKDVGRELPPVSKIAHTVESDPKVMEQLGGPAIELARTILAANERWRGERMQAAGEFDALMRQATGVAKAPYVAQFVRLLVESGQPVLLFGWHREVYSIWMEQLAEFAPVMYTGSESATQKQEAKEAFVSGRSKVLMMSLRSGAGVDGLQAMCSTVVFGELDWSPGVHEQCVGRVDRDGQTVPVMAYYLMSEEGADPIIADVLGVKREQIEGVRNPGGPLAERVDTGENTLRRLAAEFLKSKGLHAREDKGVLPMVGAVEG